MQQERISPADQWRWKMIRQVAEYINQPDDSNMAELKATIESYRDYHNIQKFIPGRNN